MSGVAPDLCGEKFTGSIMVSIPPPAYGWEPMMESDTCTRPKGHEGHHSGKKLILKELAE